MLDVLSRTIDHNPDVLFNRWHFAGTEIPVAEVLLDYRAETDRNPDTYEFLDRSTDEIRSALSFSFPAVRTVSISSAFLVLTIACECGEDTYRTINGDWTDDVQCVCGRIWSVMLAVVPKPGLRIGAQGKAPALV